MSQSWYTKLSITHSFYELQTPDFTRKFVQIFPTKYKSTKSTKVLITQPFFELQTPDFAWKFIWTVQPNDKVQKYKKYKNSKNAKNDKNPKNVKSTKVQKKLSGASY